MRNSSIKTCLILFIFITSSCSANIKAIPPEEKQIPPFVETSFIEQAYEFDMLKHDGEIPEDKRNLMIEIYHQAEKKNALIEKNMGKIKGTLFREILEIKRNEIKISQLKKQLKELNNEYLDIKINSMDEIAKVIAVNDADRDYIYRAFLREQRRSANSCK